MSGQDSAGRFPMPIEAVDLEELDPRGATAVPRETLFVFRSHGLPVGHAYAACCDRLRLSELARRSVSAAAVEYAAGAAATSPGTATAAVVVCTRDRPDELARCLASFTEQSRRPEQVIVVDNASRDDRTRRVAEAAGVDYVREDRAGLDHARNTGALRARTDIVAYADDDTMLHPRWLERTVAAFDSPEVMAVTGLILPGELETEAQYLFETHWGFGRGYLRIDFGPDFYAEHRRRGCPSWKIGAGANMAFRREVFDRIGLFDERLDVGQAGCSGDSEFWNRILHHGYTCRYEPSAVVFHFHRRTAEGLARQIRAYMSGHVAALLVAYQRTREAGNLRRVFVTLPSWFARRAMRRAFHGSSADSGMFREELLGSLDGLLFFLHAPRPDSVRRGR